LKKKVGGRNLWTHNLLTFFSMSTHRDEEVAIPNVSLENMNHWVSFSFSYLYKYIDVCRLDYMRYPRVMIGIGNILLVIL
jgi:hypothetical protein